MIDRITKLMERRRRAELPRPRLADDVELIGEYSDSGFREPPYIVRRGRSILQLSRLLYLVAEATDGNRDLEQIAQRVSAEFGRLVSVSNLAVIYEQKLAPLGLLVGSESVPRPVDAAAPLALTSRVALVPACVVRPVAALFRILFAPLFVGAVLTWLVLVDLWVFKYHGLDEGILEILRRPILGLLVFGLLLVSTVFHEIGHAAACRYGGARPGAMGAGLYVLWPAFYTDVTDAYRLNRRGRLRTDLGGVYFNIVFVLGLAGVYAWTRFEPLLVAIAIQHVQVLMQFTPWVRLDGYYVLTDLTGVPDILSHVKPILLSLIPDRDPDRAVTELKPWVRVAVTAYVLTLAPAFVLAFGLLAWKLPEYYDAARTSFRTQRALIDAALQVPDWGAAALGAVQLGVLLLPALGIALGLVRLVLALLRGLGPRRRFRLALALVVAGSLFFVGLTVGTGGTTFSAPKVSDAHSSGKHTRSSSRKNTTPGIDRWSPTEPTKTTGVDRWSPTEGGRQ